MLKHFPKASKLVRITRKLSTCQRRAIIWQHTCAILESNMATKKKQMVMPNMPVNISVWRHAYEQL